ncbi:MAG: ABC transporter ATP-binding protein [Firmicutes bacterium]|nr:ABC transporter ATP-binding protein [Bacillota bacterium]
MMELVKCINVNKTIGNKKILEDINLVIPRGKIVGLLGKNGAGKSTLIKLINDLLIPTSGEIMVNGEKIGVNSKKIISYLPERTYLDKTMTVEKVIEYFENFYDNFDSEKARKLFKDLDLDTNQKLTKMSKGMQEKVQLILVMSRKADLYILDEPLGGVDPATRDYILDTILTNFNEGASVIISTHLIADIERILDEVIFIDKGKIILQSDSDELRSKENSSIDEIFRRMFKC